MNSLKIAALGVILAMSSLSASALTTNGPSDLVRSAGFAGGIEKDDLRG